MAFCMNCMYGSAKGIQLCSGLGLNNITCFKQLVLATERLYSVLLCHCFSNYEGSYHACVTISLTTETKKVVTLSVTLWRRFSAYGSQVYMFYG